MPVDFDIKEGIVGNPPDHSVFVPSSQFEPNSHLDGLVRRDVEKRGGIHSILGHEDEKCCTPSPHPGFGRQSDLLPPQKETRRLQLEFETLLVCQGQSILDLGLFHKTLLGNYPIETTPQLFNLYLLQARNSWNVLVSEMKERGFW